MPNIRQNLPNILQIYRIFGKNLIFDLQNSANFCSYLVLAEYFLLECLAEYYAETVVGRTLLYTLCTFQLKPLRKEAEKYYFFSDFAASLNEMEEGVAPTDSRLRPDQRMMEDALWDEANDEKVSAVQ